MYYAKCNNFAQIIQNTLVEAHPGITITQILNCRCFLYDYIVNIPCNQKEEMAHKLMFSHIAIITESYPMKSVTKIYREFAIY